MFQVIIPVSLLRSPQRCHRRVALRSLHCSNFGFPQVAKRTSGRHKQLGPVAPDGMPELSGCTAGFHYSLQERLSGRRSGRDTCAEATPGRKRWERDAPQSSVHTASREEEEEGEEEEEETHRPAPWTPPGGGARCWQGATVGRTPPRAQ